MNPKEKHVKDAIDNIEIKVDCDVIDRRTRKLLIYLIDKEIKFWKGFPRLWVEDQLYNLNALKEKLLTCDLNKIEKGKKGRELTEYQKHMKRCMSEDDMDFGRCVEAWRMRKTSPQDS